MLLIEDPVCSFFYQLELYDMLYYFQIKLYENNYTNQQVYSLLFYLRDI